MLRRAIFFADGYRGEGEKTEADEPAARYSVVNLQLGKLFLANSLIVDQFVTTNGGLAKHSAISLSVFA